MPGCAFFRILENNIAAHPAETGFTYAVAGQRDQVEHILRQLRQRSKHAYVRSLSFAIIYAGLGDKQKSFAFLDKAYSEHDDLLPAARVIPPFRCLHGDPRFSRLLARMHLPD